jgi:putative DNA primase/helicase
MSAAEIVAALGGRWQRSYGTAGCPAHNDHNPSLSIREGADGKILVKCHAGCEHRAIITALRGLGLWPQFGEASRPLTAVEKDQRRQEHTEQGREQDTKRIGAALAIWGASVPAYGTLVTTYLASRGLHLPPPTSLRFHPGLTHPSGGTWPAMVALVTRGSDGTPLAIHRTFVAHDGASKAPVDPSKMMLGPCRGGAVRLAVAGDVLMVGEGIETCLAAMQATGHPAWAALSTSGLRGLELPHDVRDVVVLADGDDPGEMAARNCAWRWRRGGRRVRIARPPKGMDFNDMLVGCSPRIEEGAR